jgi:hypothetical protein
MQYMWGWCSGKHSSLICWLRGFNSYSPYLMLYASLSYGSNGVAALMGYHSVAFY